MRKFIYSIVAALALTLILLFHFAQKPTITNEIQTHSDRPSIRDAPSPNPSPSNSATGSDSEKENRTENLTLPTVPSQAEIIENQAKAIIRADLCDNPRFEKSLSVEKMIAHAKSNGDSKAAELTQRQLTVLCKESSMDSPLGFGDPMDFVREHSDLAHETEAFLSLVEEDAHKGIQAVSATERAEFVLDKLRRAESLFEFNAVATELAEASLLGPALQTFGYPQRTSNESSAVAAAIAGCRIFGGCAANTELALIHCLLTCERPMGVEEYLMSTVPPRDHTKIAEAVSAIISARNRP